MKVSCAQFIRTHLRGSFPLAVVLPLVAPLCLVAPAHAAEAPDDPTAGAPPPPTFVQLDTIVVTANKRLEPQQDVPMAISVLSDAQLENERAFSFADYASQVPGLNIISIGQGQTQLSLRGITTGGNTPNATVGTYIDDVPYGSSTVYNQGSVLTPDFDPYDLKQIEVLRGPQGTLYGANTLGGLIKFVTAAPDTSSYSARLTIDGSHVEGGGTGADEHAMVNVPLLENQLGLRISAYNRTDPGYIDNILTGAHDVNKATVRGGRAQLLWTPNDDVSVRLSVLGQNLASDGLSNGGIDIDAASLQPLTGFGTQTRSAGTGRFDVAYRLYSLAVSDDLHFAKIISNTSYSTLRLQQNLDATALYQPAIPVLLAPAGITLDTTGVGFSVIRPTSLNKFTQEVRIQSPEEQFLAWRAGVFFQREASTDPQQVTSFNQFTGAPLDLGLGNLGTAALQAVYREWAVYADATVHATSKLAITVGARFSDDRTRYSQVSDGLLIGTTNLRQSDESHPVTFLFNPSYKLTENVMPYVRIASGFRPGGPNVGVPVTSDAPQTFNPDKLISYDVGLKSILLDQKMSVDISLFYIDWHDVQLTAQAPSGVTYLSNGGKASSRGVELGIRYAPMRGTTVYINGTYTDAHLNEDTPPPVFGHADDALPYTAKVATSVGVDQTFPLGAELQGFVGASYSYVGPRRTDFNAGVDIPGLRLPGYNDVDLHAGVKQSNWTVQLYAKNLANSQGILAVSSESLLFPPGGPFNASYQPPRTIGVSASVGF